MSETVAVSSTPSGAILKKIEFTEKQMKEFKSKFENDTDAVGKSVQAVIATMNHLKGTFNRQRVEIIADSVQKGDLAEASEKLRDNYVDLEPGQVEEILKMSLTGAGPHTLKNAINFVDFVELKSAACKFLYEEMRFMNRLRDVEILLLQCKMKGLEDKLLAETKKKIAADVDKLIKRLAEEAKKGETVLSKKVVETCSKDVFDTVIPIIVEKFFALPSSNAKQLAQYSQEFPYLSNMCILVGAAFEHLKKRGVLRTEPALHLWAHARYLMEAKNFPKVSGANQRLVTDCQNEMSMHQDYYFDVLKEKVNEKKLIDFFGKSCTMLVVLGEFVKLFYAGNRQQYKQLAAAMNGVFFYDCIGRVQKSLYEEMEKFDHLATFEAFQSSTILCKRQQRIAIMMQLMKI